MSIARVENLYTVLGVSETDDRATIRKAWAHQRNLFNTDRNPSPIALDRSVAVNLAYEVLRDPEKRARHDAALAAQRRADRDAEAAKAKADFDARAAGFENAAEQAKAKAAAAAKAAADARAAAAAKAAADAEAARKAKPEPAPAAKPAPARKPPPKAAPVPPLASVTPRSYTGVYVGLAALCGVVWLGATIEQGRQPPVSEPATIATPAPSPSARPVRIAKVVKHRRKHRRDGPSEVAAANRREAARIEAARLDAPQIAKEEPTPGATISAAEVVDRITYRVKDDR